MAAAPETEDGMRALGIRMACVVARCAKGQDTCQMSKDLPSGTGCRRGGVGGNLLQIFVCVYLPRLKNILWHGVYARSWGGGSLARKVGPPVIRVRPVHSGRSPRRVRDPLVMEGLEWCPAVVDVLGEVQPLPVAVSCTQTCFRSAMSRPPHSCGTTPACRWPEGGTAWS